MPTYKTIAVKLDPADTTVAKTLYQPTPLYAGLIQGIRVRSQISNTGSPTAPPEALLRIVTATEPGFVIGVIPLPPTGKSEYYDVMPYLSNLANYGLAPSDKITIEMSETLQSGDGVRFWGFAIEGLEE